MVLPFLEAVRAKEGPSDHHFNDSGVDTILLRIDASLAPIFRQRKNMSSEFHLKELARQALARLKAVRLERARLKVELGTLKSELQSYRERLATWKKSKGPGPVD